MRLNLGLLKSLSLSKRSRVTVKVEGRKKTILRLHTRFQQTHSKIYLSNFSAVLYTAKLNGNDLLQGKIYPKIIRYECQFY